MHAYEIQLFFNLLFSLKDWPAQRANCNSSSLSTADRGWSQHDHAGKRNVLSAFPDVAS
jgi:hypothetical protein